MQNKWRLVIMRTYVLGFKGHSSHHAVPFKSMPHRAQEMQNDQKDQCVTGVQMNIGANQF